MINRYLISLVVYVLAASVASAQSTVSVSSGEHPNFSRLVFTPPPQTQLRFRQLENSLVVEAEGRGMVFNDHRVFDRIPRTRVANTAVTETLEEATLTVDLNCTCPLEIFALPNNAVVIDVINPGVSYSIPEGAALLFRSAANGPGQPNEPPEFSPNVAAEASAQTARAELFRQLTRAVDQGFLSIEQQGGTNEASPTDATLGELASLLSEVPEVSARTALDRDAEIAAQARRDSQYQQCTLLDQFDPTTWTDARSFLEQLVAAREESVGEFDIPDPAAVTKLTRLYLSFGFAVEAIAVIEEFSSAVTASDAYLDVARILDDRTLPPDTPLLDWLSCDHAARIWPLAAGLAVKAEPLKAVIATLEDSPAPLRMGLGSRVVARLIDIDAVEPAQDIHDLIQRSGLAPSPLFQLNEARLAIEEGRLSFADAVLKQLRRQDDVVAHRAAIVQSKAIRQFSSPPDDTLLVDLERFAFLNRGTELGRDLLIEQVWQEARGQNLSIALQVLQFSTDSFPDPDDVVGVTRLDIVEAAVADPSSPTDLARAIVNDLEALPLDPSADAARLNAATELATIGLPGLAELVLNPMLDRSVPSAKILLARLALAEGDFDRAIFLVDGLDGEAAEEILQLAGGLREPFVQEQSGDEVVSIGGNSVTENISIGATAPTVSLSATRRLIEQSQSTRRALEEVLDRP